MQQELIEMLEEIIQYVEVWRAQDQEVIDKAEALIKKAKNNAPSVPVAWWIPKAEQFCLAKPSGERPFAKAWEPLYAAPAVPQGEPEAYMVYGNYTRQPFRSVESAQAYMGGLLKSDPEGGYHIRPLFYATPAAPSQPFAQRKISCEQT